MELIGVLTHSSINPALGSDRVEWPGRAAGPPPRDPGQTVLDPRAHPPFAQIQPFVGGPLQGGEGPRGAGEPSGQLALQSVCSNLRGPRYMESK